MARPIAVLSVVDAVAVDLRDRLLAGRLAGGQTLTEAEIAREYDVARPTAKAAIEQLVADGLLQREVHKTARVPILGADEVRDIYATRAHLEGEALRRLALDRTVPGAAREANDLLARVGTDNGLEAVEPDMRFHAALIDALNSRRLSQMYGSLVQEVKLCMAQVQGRHLLTVDSIAEEHRRILELLAAGEGANAAELLHAHLGRASERLAAAITDRLEDAGDGAGPEKA